MKQPITRRGLIAGLGAATAAAALAQETPPTAAVAEDDLKTARDLMRENLAKLAAVKLPMSTEPAFIFKA